MELTNFFTQQGVSNNGKVTLDMQNAYHNCNPQEAAYEQTTTIYILDNSDGVSIVTNDEDNFDNTITFTVSWEIVNADAEDESEVCDWDDFEITADYQGYSLEALLCN
jgi:hypothetical protein